MYIKKSNTSFLVHKPENILSGTHPVAGRVPALIPIEVPTR